MAMINQSSWSAEVIKYTRLRLGLVAALFFFILAGCDGSYGPMFYNTTNEAVQIKLTFESDTRDRQFFTLHAQQAYSNMMPGMRLLSLVIVSNGQQHEYKKQQLEPLLAKLMSQDDALVLIEKDGITVESLNQARRDGFFSVKHSDRTVE